MKETARRHRDKRLVLVEVAVVAAIFLADRYDLIAFSKTPWLIVLAIASLVVRRMGAAAVGLSVPKNWPVALLAGLLLGAAMEAFQLYLSQPILTQLIGQPPDLSDFATLRGNVKFLAIGLALAWVLAAFGEEFFYRGYLLNRFRDFFGANAVGAVIALVASSAIFGSAHAYQGLTGVIDEGLMGLILGIAFLAAGRNLMVPIVAHGMQDTIDLWLLYSGNYPLPAAS